MSAAEEAAARKAALRLTEDIPDVTPVKKGFGWTVIALFTAFLVLPTLIWGILSLCSPGTAENLNFDTGENRALAAFPEKFDPATFPAEVEAWYNDHLPFRSVLYKTQETLDNKLEAPYQETLRPALIKLFYGNMQGVGGEQLFDPFADSRETEAEGETLPEFETGALSPSDCTHRFSAESQTVKEATCSDYGVIGYRCVLCGTVGNKAYTQKLPHELVSSNPTLPYCGQKYEETLTCSVCRYSETLTLEKAHRAGDTVRVAEPSYQDYGYTLVRCRDCGHSYRTELKNKLYYTDYLPPIYHGSTVFEGRDGWLYYLGDQTLDYYQGSNLPTQNELSHYLDTLTKLKKICDKKGIQLVIAVWPNKEEAYAEYMPSFEIYNQYRRVDRWVDYVTENSDVNVIYPVKELLEAKPYCQTYFPYDTHWNNAGAFVGYQALLKALGLETTSLQNLPIRELRVTDPDYKDFVWDYNSDLAYAPKNGTCYLGGLNGDRYDVANYIVDYRPEVKVMARQGNNGADDIRHSTSTGPNDLNFVMLADSFRVMQLTYLERDFTDCYLCHRNQVKNRKTEKAILNADVLVIAAVERYEQDLLRTAAEVIRILTQQ